MAPHLTDEMRANIIRWRYKEGRSAEDIASMANCGISTVYRTCNATPPTVSQVSNSQHDRRGRPRLLDPYDVEHIESVVEKKKTIYLSEIQSSLVTQREVHASSSIIHRTLEQGGLTKKAVTSIPLARDDALRAVWRVSVADLLPEQLVFIDECGVEVKDFCRKRGWSLEGTRCRVRQPFGAGTRVSVIPALTLNGVIALDILEGGVNRDRFVEFLSNHLAGVLNPFPQRRSVVIMDNVAIHHGEDIRKIIEDECGAKLIYLPPYSPDYNPIEEAFSALKAFLRQHEDYASTDDSRVRLIKEGLATMRRDDIEGWFRHSGYM